MKYTGMPWDIWTLITPLFRERCREEGTVRSFRCRHSGYRFDTSFLSPHYGGDSGIRTHGPLRIKRFRVISRLCLLVEIKRIWKYTTEAKMLRYTADFGFRFSLLFEPTELSEFFPFLPRIMTGG